MLVPCRRAIRLLRERRRISLRIAGADSWLRGALSAGEADKRALVGLSALDCLHLSRDPELAKRLMVARPGLNLAAHAHYGSMRLQRRRSCVARHIQDGLRRDSCPGQRPSL